MPFFNLTSNKIGANYAILDIVNISNSRIPSKREVNMRWHLITLGFISILAIPNRLGITQDRIPQTRDDKPSFTFAGPNIDIVQTEGSKGLRLIEAKGEFSKDDTRSQLSCAFLNASDQQLVAYNITVRVMAGDRILSEKSLTYDSKLVPGDLPKDPSAIVRLTISNLDFPAGVPPTVINVILDYAEYADGSTMGRNLAGGRQLIQGQRTGKYVIMQYLKERFISGDIEAVRKTLGVVR